MTMVHASLFSGIGGPEVAAEMMGWTNAFHCEINPFGRKVLEYWYPESKSYEDITKTDFTPWRGKIDILTGGFPCQPFSYAGKRGGAEDNRYLWPQMLRAIDEIRPTWVVGENVAGITTMVEGGVCTDMGGQATLWGEGDGVHRYALRETFTIERICRDLESHGYSVQPLLIPAAAVGAPHRRDRIFILAYADDAYHDDTVRGAGAVSREAEREGIFQRDEVQFAGVADSIRREVARAIADTSLGLCDGRIAGIASDTEQPESELGDGHFKDATNTNLQRCNQPKSPEEPGEAKRLHRQAHSRWGDGSLRPERRWATFPTISPIHRGNDGLSFSLDDLAVSPNYWRTESLKAYGNAILPQVMFRIFQAIDAATAKPKLRKKDDEFQYRSCWTCRACSLDIGHTPAVHLCSKDGTVIGDNYRANSMVCDDWIK